MNNEQLKLMFSDYGRYPAEIKANLMRAHGNYYEDAFNIGHNIVQTGLDVTIVTVSNTGPASVARMLYMLEKSGFDYEVKTGSN
jgi:hypothetical protein